METDIRLSEEIFKFLSLVQRKLMRPFEDSIRNEFTGLQFTLLCELKKHDSMTMTELAESIHMTKQQMTKVIDRLFEEGHIVRNYDSADRRLIRISISERTGKAITDESLRFVTVINSILNTLEEDDKERFKESLCILDDVLSKFPNL